MDDSRFDSLTKNLSMISSRRYARRAALRGLGGALLGGAVAGLPVGRRATLVLAQCTPDGVGCFADTECCSGACSQGECEESMVVVPPPVVPPPVFPTLVVPPAAVPLPVVPPERKERNDREKKERNDREKREKKEGNSRGAAFAGTMNSGAAAGALQNAEADLEPAKEELRAREAEESAKEQKREREKVKRLKDQFQQMRDGLNEALRREQSERIW